MQMKKLKSINSRHKQKYQESVGPKVQKCLTIIDHVVDRKNGLPKEVEAPPKLLEMFNLIEEVVFQWGFATSFDARIAKQTNEQGKQVLSVFGNLIAFIQNADSAQLKEAPESFINNIN